MDGSGNAHTVNGKVSVFFSRNPKSDCSFRTINGNVELSFPGRISADFLLKTFNGKIYSDYEVEYLPVSPVKGTRKNGKWVYKSSRFQAIRISSGGPNIKMDTLNGNLLIAKNK